MEEQKLVEMRAEVKRRVDVMLAEGNIFGAYCEDEQYVIVGGKMAMYGKSTFRFNKLLFDTIVEEVASRGLWSKLSREEYESKKQDDLKKLRDDADLKQ